MNYRELRRLTELDGAQETVRRCTEALEQGELKPEDFSLRELAEAVIPDGREFVRACDPREGVLVSESFDGVDSTAFINISGQIIFTKILEAAKSPAFKLSALVETIPTRFSGEKIPGVGKLLEDINTVPEGMPFEHRGFSEDYITTPDTEKRGFIVPVTKEAIFFDRTRLVLENARQVGETLGLNKEKRIVDVVSGASNPFIWNGVSYNTYQTSTPWINSITTNELLDVDDVDALEQLLHQQTDRVTGEPIMFPSNLQILVTPTYKHRARQVVHATDVRRGDGASNTVAAYGPNTLDPYNVVDSIMLYHRLVASGVSASAAKKYWYLGDIGGAFAYMENWPITVTQAPVNSEAEFTSDILYRFKASERGAAAVIDPQKMVRTTGAT